MRKYIHVKSAFSEAVIEANQITRFSVALINLYHKIHKGISKLYETLKAR